MFEKFISYTESHYLTTSNVFVSSFQTHLLLSWEGLYCNNTKFIFHLLVLYLPNISGTIILEMFSLVHNWSLTHHVTDYVSKVTLWNICVIFPNFQNCVCCKKYFIFSPLSMKTNSFPRVYSSRKTLSFEEQVMSKDKYPSLFSCHMEAIVFIVLQTIFFATCTVFKIGEYSRIFFSAEENSVTWLV